MTMALGYETEDVLKAADKCDESADNGLDNVKQLELLGIDMEELSNKLHRVARTALITAVRDHDARIGNVNGEDVIQFDVATAEGVLAGEMLRGLLIGITAAEMKVGMRS